MSDFNIFRKSLIIKRYSGGAYVHGIWSESAPNELTIRGSVQPVTSEDLQRLPEARRLFKLYRVYSEEHLKSVRENLENPDIVVISGEDYEVIDVDDWSNGIIQHYKSIVARIQE